MTDLKEEIEEILHPNNKMLEVSLERLTPPKPIVDDKSVAVPVTERNRVLTSIPTGSTSTIDYEGIAKSSEFQRFIYFLLMGKTHRGTQRNLRRDVTVKMNKFRGSGMGAVINEFKDKVERLRNEKNT